MPKLAANLSMQFNEVPFLERFATAAAAGFSGVDFLIPYDHPADEVARRLSENGLELALFNLPPGDWNAGERGLAALRQPRAPGRSPLQRWLQEYKLASGTELGGGSAENSAFRYY